MRHHRHRHPPWRKPPRAWLLVRGIHRRVVLYLLVAAMLGAGGGFALHSALVGEAGPRAIALAVGLLLAIWPLAWVALFRIARPVAQLAEAAGRMRAGHLRGRHALPEHDGEVGEVADALHEMAERVSRQLEEQRALMAAVSHELRSPLARLRVLVELQREGHAPASVHDDLQGEIDGMDALVGDLLAAARIDFEAVSPTELDARDVALRALELAGLPAKVLEGEAVGAVRADATLLARALTVLLDNATRHGGTAPRLRVTGDERSVRWTVDDDGPGFGAGEEEAVFQPFYRAPAGARAGGVGLGLALVRQIASAHGGTAAAANRDGGGASVWVELPRSGVRT